MSSGTTTEAYLGLGANLGNPVQMPTQAVHKLNSTDGITVSKCSSLYRTSPVGKTDQPDFINMAVRIDTTMTADRLMTSILEIEQSLGRVRTDRWGPRTIDIDLLIFGDLVTDTKHLTVPHPRMVDRRFVLIPLIEIAPNLIVPGTATPLKEFLNKTENQGNISVLELVVEFKA